MKRKIVEILESHLYVTDKGWTFGIDDDDKQRQFGVVFEIIDMAEATGEEEFEEYPFLVSASIVADKPHRSFHEGGADRKPDNLSLIYDAMSYMGGVPIDHVLQDAVKKSTETGDAFDSLAREFSAAEAIVRTVEHRHGTVAAQRGPGTTTKYLQFKTDEAARKFVDLLVERRVDALSMMIGFILDRPINMIGDDGWSVMRTMVNGAKS